MGRGLRSYLSSSTNSSSEAHNLSLEELMPRAIFSIELSKDRGLGDSSMVLDVVRRCELEVPSAEKVEKIARAVVQDQRLMPPEELARDILSQLLES
jgi:hypothetical protein